MPVVRIDDKGMTIVQKRKEHAKKTSLGLLLVAAAAIATYYEVSPEAGIMVGLIVPTVASLLNLWSD